MVFSGRAGVSCGSLDSTAASQSIDFDTLCTASAPEDPRATATRNQEEEGHAGLQCCWNATSAEIVETKKTETCLGSLVTLLG